MRGWGRYVNKRCGKPWLLAIGLVLHAFAQASGQNAVPPPAESNPTRPAEARPAPSAAIPDSQPAPMGVAAPPFDVIYLLDENGKPVPVPLGASTIQFLDFLRQRPSEDEPTTGTQVSVASIEAKGTVVDDRAELTITAVVQVDPGVRSNESVRQALGLTEGVLRGFSYEGNGAAMFDGVTPEAGQRWWFRGPGTHRLTLTMVVPLRKQAPVRRLQLSLPSAAVSTLELTVPYKVSTFRSADSAVVDSTKLEDGSTRVRVVGVGQRLDVNWQREPDTPLTTSLESFSSILARVNADSVLLEMNQRVQALQGLFSEIKTTLPPGTTVLKIEGREYASHTVDSSVPPVCTVTLTEPSAGPVALKWTLSQTRANRDRFEISEFQVLEARKQTGEIAVVLEEGLQLSPRDIRDPNVLRISLLELGSTLAPGVHAKRAYRFLGQPFQLAVDVSRIEPYFVARPRHILAASLDRLMLESSFVVQVHRGQLDEISMDWPGYESAGWRIESVQPSDLVESYVVETVDGASKIRAQMVQPVRDRVTLTVRARRDNSPLSPAGLVLPYVSNANRMSARLTVLEAEKVRVDLSSSTGLRVFSEPEGEQDALSDDYANLRRTDYVGLADGSPLSLTVIPQSREVRVTSETRVEFDHGDLACRQMLNYDVSYDRLSELRLSLPAELRSRPVAYLLVDEKGKEDRLTPVVSTAEGDAVGTVVLRLPSPLIGRFGLAILFELPLPEDVSARDQNVIVPIAESLDVPLSTTDLLFRNGDWFEASTSLKDWNLLSSEADQRRWRASGPRSQFELTLSPVRSDEVGSGVITSALFHLVVDQSGRVSARAQFRMSGLGGSLKVICPEKIAPPRFAIQDQLLPPEDLVELPAGSRRYSLHLPESLPRDQETLLTIDYELPTAGVLGASGEVVLDVPRFPQCSWRSQVVWEVVLPGSQHLFSYPSTATPLFRWHRERFYWRRVCERNSEQLQAWIGSDQGPAPVGIAANGNVYCFSQFGSPIPLTIRTLSAPMVVFCGAGLSLLVGFVLLRVPGLQNLLTMLVLAFLFAAIGVWYMAPLELLLQPAVAGLIFPIIAISIDHARRRRFGGAVLTLPRPGTEYGGPSTRSALAVSGGDDVTRLRTVSPGEHSAREIEAGTGVS